MEAVKFKICEQCNGQGKVDGKKCQTCFGSRNFYFYNNNFLYWQKDISHSHIFVNEFKQFINIIINAALIMGVFLTLILVFVILDRVEFEPRLLWLFLTTPDPRNFHFWALVIRYVFILSFN